jgi:16S rRNA (guanine966-N2)-methyltransferase
MSVKIIGGEARGFSFDIPPESITRPTSVLLKRRLFDYYQNLTGYYFIDLCSGSGSIGLEASSRGASPVSCIESSSKAYKVLEKNIKSFQNKFHYLDREITSQKIDVLRWMDKFRVFYATLNKEEEERVILYFDPPYEDIELYKAFFIKLREINFFGVLITEACRQKTMPIESFKEEFGLPTRNYRQGTSFLFLYDYNDIKR